MTLRFMQPETGEHAGMHLKQAPPSYRRVCLIYTYLIWDHVCCGLSLHIYSIYAAELGSSAIAASLPCKVAATTTLISLLPLTLMQC